MSASSATPPPLHTLSTLCLKGYVDYPRLRALACDAGTTPPALLDALSIRTARAYAERRMDFNDADFIMNTLAELCTSPEFVDAHQLPPGLTMAAYLAFDAGEYRRPGDAADVDPVKAYTDPMVRRFLARAESASAARTLALDTLG